jgi:hypothetical protein
MCFKIPANTEKDSAKARLSSDKATMSGRPKDLDHVECQAAMCESGLIAMLRRLFASFKTEPASSRPHDDNGKRTRADKREVENVH